MSIHKNLYKVCHYTLQFVKQRHKNLHSFLDHDETCIQKFGKILKNRTRKQRGKTLIKISPVEN